LPFIINGFFYQMHIDWMKGFVKYILYEEWFRNTRLYPQSQLNISFMFVTLMRNLFCFPENEVFTNHKQKTENTYMPIYHVFTQFGKWPVSKKYTGISFLFNTEDEFIYLFKIILNISYKNSKRRTRHDTFGTFFRTDFIIFNLETKKFDTVQLSSSPN
jgi:hypothetical protein